MPRKPTIAVIGSGRSVGDAVSNAFTLGGIAGQRGWVLITGGRNAGAMKAANEGAREHGGLTIGVLPDGDTEISQAVDVAIVTDMGEARNNIIVLSADVVVACGVDDPGTASEVALALKAGKPVVVLGADVAARDFFSGIRPGDILIAEDPKAAVELIEDILGKRSADTKETG